MAGLAGLRALMRRSLILRVTVAALVAGAVLITVLLGVVTVTIRESVFSDKRDAVLADAMERVRTAQAVLDAATVTSPDEVAFLAQTQVTSIRGSSAGAGGVGVALRRSGSESSSVAINDLSTDSAMDALVTHDITQAVEDAPAGVDSPAGSVTGEPVVDLGEVDDGNRTIIVRAVGPRWADVDLSPLGEDASCQPGVPL